VALLTVNTIKVSFNLRNGTVRAVNNVSLTINKGEIVGLVGESGSGKSLLCLAFLRLIPAPPGKIEQGKAIFNSTDLLTCSNKEIRSIRGNQMTMIFQDPMTSLNPWLTIAAQLTEPLMIHKGISKKKSIKQAVKALEEVGIADPERRIYSYPHELSGGMRQRVMIAMALITRPALIIADEPTTALDVTVQAQILELMKDLQQSYGMAMLFITHDLGVVAHLCDRVMVMYAGRIVETAMTEDLFYHPQHPYTEALIRTVPSIDTIGNDLYVIEGMPPDLSTPIQGCPFAPRCTYAIASCTECDVSLHEIRPSHSTACCRIVKGQIEGFNT
jgi:oligopeptide transport system ATP-binding protein